MVLFRSETPAVACALIVRKRQPGNNDSDCQNATDDDRVSFVHDNLLTVCVKIFGFQIKHSVYSGLKLTINCGANMKKKCGDCRD